MEERFEFFKDQYYFELNRKNELTNSLAIPIGFLTALFTGYAYFFSNLNYLDSIYFIFCFSVLTCVSIFFGIRALSHLFKSIRGLEYGYVPEPKHLYKYEQDYINYLKSNGLPLNQVNEKFFENLKLSLVTTTNRNRENNNSRANRILKANINTIYALLFLFFAALPFMASKNLQEINKQKHEQWQQTIQNQTKRAMNQ